VQFPAGAPAPLVKCTPGPAVTVQIFCAVHKYTFCPETAMVLKNTCPTLHVAGSAVPTFQGIVEPAPEKSTSLV